MSWFLQARTSRAPRPARWSAVARPMPVLPPGDAQVRQVRQVRHTGETVTPWRRTGETDRQVRQTGEADR